MGMETPHRFAAGEPVPEWLFYREPTAPEAAAGSFTFATDAEVVDEEICGFQGYRLRPIDGAAPAILKIADFKHYRFGNALALPLAMADRVFASRATAHAV